jgi:predicted TPR repeat methyltransferase
VFTVEAQPGTGGGFTLQPHGRYTHDRNYVLRVLQDAGLEPDVTEVELRLERGIPVAGLLVTAVKPSGTVEAPVGDLSIRIGGSRC